MNEIQTKVFGVFHLAIHSHLFNFALRFLFLQIHPTSYSFYIVLLYTVKQKGGKPDRKPHPLSYGLRKPYRNLNPENSQDNAQKLQRNCTVRSLIRFLVKSFRSDTEFYIVSLSYAKHKNFSRRDTASPSGYKLPFLGLFSVDLGPRLFRLDSPKFKRDFLCLLLVIHLVFYPPYRFWYRSFQ